MGGSEAFRSLHDNAGTRALTPERSSLPKQFSPNWAYFQASQR
jgi:hypothetical protein